jgi:hypothetical protein
VIALIINILLLPMCALVAVIGTALVVSDKETNDHRLFEAFTVLFVMALLLGYGILTRPTVQRALDPHLALEYLIEHDPVAQATRSLGDSERNAILRLALADADAQIKAGKAAQLNWRKARALMEKYGDHELGWGDSASRTAWANVYVQTLIELQRQSDQACFSRIVNSTNDYYTLKSPLNEANQAAFEQAFILLMKSRTESLNRKPNYVSSGPTFEDLQGRYLDISKDLEARHGSEVMRLMRLRPHELKSTGKGYEQAICNARIDQVKSALAEPPEYAGRLIDSLLR